MVKNSSLADGEYSGDEGQSPVHGTSGGRMSPPLNPTLDFHGATLTASQAEAFEKAIETSKAEGFNGNSGAAAPNSATRPSTKPKNLTSLNLEGVINNTRQSIQAAKA